MKRCVIIVSHLTALQTLFISPHLTFAPNASSKQMRNMKPVFICLLLIFIEVPKIVLESKNLFLFGRF